METIATSIVSLIAAVAADNAQGSATAIREAMLKLLALPLLGNETPELAAFAARLGAYRLTFILCDIFALVAHLLCSRRTAVRARRRQGCACSRCLHIFQLRQQFHFLGPAPRSLARSLYRLPVQDLQNPRMAGQNFDMLHQLLQHINSAWGCRLDLYAIEVLSCVWRRFVSLV